MVKVSIRVQNGTARFDVAITAESAQRALSLIGGRYRTSEVRVRSLTALAGSSVDGPAALTDGFLLPDAMAA